MIVSLHLLVDGLKTNICELEYLLLSFTDIDYINLMVGLHAGRIMCLFSQVGDIV